MPVPVAWTPGQPPGAVVDCGRCTNRDAYSSPLRTAPPAAANAASGVVVLPEVTSTPAALYSFSGTVVLAGSASVALPPAYQPLGFSAAIATPPAVDTARARPTAATHVFFTVIFMLALLERSE